VAQTKIVCMFHQFTPGNSSRAALRALGVLEYSEGLAAKIDAGQELPPGGCLCHSLKGKSKPSFLCRFYFKIPHSYPSNIHGGDWKAPFIVYYSAQQVELPLSYDGSRDLLILTDQLNQLSCVKALKPTKKVSPNVTCIFLASALCPLASCLMRVYVCVCVCVCVLPDLSISDIDNNASVLS
jgi:hypothetical protein